MFIKRKAKKKGMWKRKKRILVGILKQAMFQFTLSKKAEKEWLNLKKFD